MKNQFDFNRFLLLVKRQWLENKKLFLMAFAVMFGLMLLFYTITTSWRGANIDIKVQLVAYFIGLYFGGALFANLILKDFSDKNSSTSYLQLPASHLEKLLVAVFFSIIVYPIIFLSFYFFIDTVFVKYVNSIHYSDVKNNIKVFSNWEESVPFLDQILKKPKMVILAMIGYWLVIQSFTILGSVFFNRWSFIKTTFSGFGILLFFSFLMILSTKFILGDLFEKSVQNFRVIQDQIRPSNDFFINMMIFCLVFIIPPALLSAAYFKLKEKQI